MAKAAGRTGPRFQSGFDGTWLKWGRTLNPLLRVGIVLYQKKKPNLAPNGSKWSQIEKSSLKAKLFSTPHKREAGEARSNLEGYFKLKIGIGGHAFVMKLLTSICNPKVRSDLVCFVIFGDAEQLWFYEHFQFGASVCLRMVTYSFNLDVWSHFNLLSPICDLNCPQGQTAHRCDLLRVRGRLDAYAWSTLIQSTRLRDSFSGWGPDQPVPCCMLPAPEWDPKLHS